MYDVENYTTDENLRSVQGQKKEMRWIVIARGRPGIEHPNTSRFNADEEDMLEDDLGEAAAPRQQIVG